MQAELFGDGFCEGFFIYEALVEQDLSEAFAVCLAGLDGIDEDLLFDQACLE
jgi:hypothetical protein